METMNLVYAPYIGANGNWYVNNEDSGVKAQGPAGPQGPVGSSGHGNDGPQGLIGPKGETGDRGPQGIRGIQGPIGETGPQGFKGDKGDQGETGPQGLRGETGLQGPKGDKGDQGEMGLQGPKGDTPTLAANLITTTTGKALDATQGKVLDDKISQLNQNLSKYTPIAPTNIIGSTNFIDGVGGSLSACKIGSMVIVTAKINVNDNVASGRLLLKDNPFSAVGLPRFDFVNTFKNMLDHSSTGCLYVNQGDNRLYFLTPKAGTYYGELIYVVA